MERPEQILRAMFDAAVASAVPSEAMLAPYLPHHPGRILVLGAGKASAAMAAAIEAHWPDRRLEGLVITPYGHGSRCRAIEVVEAAHPVPDAAGQAAAQRVLSLARSAGPEDLVIFALSGGASALLALPAPGISLMDKQAVNAALLRSGAPIGAINCVRKHLSAIKGGRLALAAAPARCISLLISDVPGDDPATIGSGPTVGDPTSFWQACDVLRDFNIDAPPAVRAHLEAAVDETPEPGDPRLPESQVHLVATPRMALEAAAAVAAGHGIEPLILSDAIEGEAREVARAMAADALSRHASHDIVLLSGGETSVAVRGKGRGGRNTEFALALALALEGAQGVHALACDTDGIDGSGDNAGALVTPDTLTRARRRGLCPQDLLAANDGYGFFAALDDLVITGPTRTNVNDFRAILIRRRTR